MKQLNMMDMVVISIKLITFAKAKTTSSSRKVVSDRL